MSEDSYIDYDDPSSELKSTKVSASQWAVKAWIKENAVARVIAAIPFDGTTKFRKAWLLYGYSLGNKDKVPPELSKRL